MWDLQFVCKSKGAVQQVECESPCTAVDSVQSLEVLAIKISSLKQKVVHWDVSVNLWI